MANFNEAILTRKGIGLLAKAQAGQSGIKLTKAASGCGSYEEGESLIEKEALKDQRQEFPLDKLSIQNSTTVSVRFTITNEQVTGNLQEGYHVKEVGIFAEDPDEGEILYALATTVEGQWDYMPAYNSLLPTYISVEFYAEVSNAASVTIVCNGRFITAEEMEEELEKLRKEAEDAHDAIKRAVPGKNTSSADGYVTKGEGNANKVWGTDAQGNPGWVTPQSGDTLPEGLKSGYVRTGQRAGTEIGKSATAEGWNSTASGLGAHVEGGNSEGSGQCSHAEGDGTRASNECSHAEGKFTSATGEYSHAEGRGTHAIGRSSHAEGQNAEAIGECSHAEGYYTSADNYASHACGKFNKAMDDGGSIADNIGDAFVIGNGTSSSESGLHTSNAFRVTCAGETYGLSAFNSSGADYAEFIRPWADGNPDNEDRVGYLVTVRDGWLHKADEGDYIAGITSGNPSVVGNADEDYYWRYERDEFDRIIWMDVPEMIPELDRDGKPVVDGDGDPIMVPTGRVIEKGAMKLAEDYDLSKQKDYVERKDRPEWDYVGMIGVLAVRDDGTCEPGKFCKCGGGGIATLATERGFDTYMVIERVTDGVVKVISK